MQQPKHVVGRIALVAASLVVAGGALVASGAPAGACSFAGPSLSTPEQVEAGGTLVVAGQGFFDIVGEVGADCGGDYELIAQEGLVVTVRFDTPTGPMVVSLDAPVTAGVEGDAERFTIGPLEVPVPADATAASVAITGFVEPVSVVVVGGPTTTTTVPPTSAPPAPAPAPAPADPVDSRPRFTG
jgi:hypothetical protein